MSLEFISASRVVGARRPYGQEFKTTVPLIETVPGAPDASTLSINVKVGAAYKKGKKVTYYGTVPKKCPKGGFPLKSELLFAGLGGLPPQTVPVTYKAPCPRRAQSPLVGAKARPLAALLPRVAQRASPRPMELVGLEPTTSSLPWKRSPAELRPSSRARP